MEDNNDSLGVGKRKFKRTVPTEFPKAWNLLQQGKAAEALRYFEAMYGSGSRFPELYEAFARAYRKLGYPEKAIRLLYQGLEEYPGNTDLQLELGMNLLAEGKYDRAEEIIELSGKKDPQAIFALGRIANARGKLEQAGSHFREGDRRYKSHEFSIALARLAEEENDIPLARHHYDLARERATKLPEIYVESATFEEKHDNVEKAKRILEAAHRECEPNLNLELFTARFYEKQPRLGSADYFYKNGTVLFPSEPEFFLGYARSLEANDDISLARYTLQDAVERFPDNATVRESLHDFEKRQENKSGTDADKSEKSLEEAIEERVDVSDITESAESPNRPVDKDIKARSDGAEQEPGLNFPNIAVCMANLMDALVTDRERTDDGADPAQVTVGLYGPWGAGKSTLVMALRKELEGRTYRCFTLNPWKWDGRADLHDFVRGAVLDQAMRKKFALGVIWWRLYMFLRTYGQRIAWLAGIPTFVGIVMWKMGIQIDLKEMKVANYAVPTGISVVGIALWGIFGKSFSQFTSNILFGKPLGALGAAGLARAFEDIARLIEFQSGDKRPFVFFIDDLDRCPPERVAAFVESIHSLTAAGCITFLACDKAYVEAALKAKYKAIVDVHEDAQDFGRRFLEKIVQIPFRVPSVSEEDLHTLGLISRDVGEGTTHMGQATVATASRMKASATIRQPDGSTVTMPSEEDTQEAEDNRELLAPARLTAIIGELLAQSVEPLQLNIRQVKSLTNTAKLYLDIRHPRSEDEARRTAAFLFANFTDADWLDCLYHQRADETAPETDGPIGTLPDLAQRLKVAIGDGDDDWLDHYRLIGRRFKSKHQLEREEKPAKDI